MKLDITRIDPRLPIVYLKWQPVSREFVRVAITKDMLEITDKTVTINYKKSYGYNHTLKAGTLSNLCNCPNPRDVIVDGKTKFGLFVSSNIIEICETHHE